MTLKQIHFMNSIDSNDIVKTIVTLNIIKNCELHSMIIIEIKI